MKNSLVSLRIRLPLLMVLTFGGVVVALAADSAPHEHAGAREGSLWTCPMHPRVMSDEPGSCSICGMDLVAKQVEKTPAPPTSGAAAIEIDPEHVPVGRRLSEMYYAEENYQAAMPIFDMLARKHDQLEIDDEELSSLPEMTLAIDSSLVCGAPIDLELDLTASELSEPLALAIELPTGTFQSDVTYADDVEGPLSDWSVEIPSGSNPWLVTATRTTWDPPTGGGV